MSEQTSIFDQAQAEAARDKSIDQVEQSNSFWIPCAVKAVRGIAEHREAFTTDAVWKVLETWEVEPPPEPRALGAAMRKCVALGLCEPTNRTKKSIRVDCHARPLRVWRSLVFKG